jgi:uncharacterized protein YoxC
MSDDLIGTIWVGVALAALLAFVFGVVISTLKDLRRTIKDVHQDLKGLKQETEKHFDGVTARFETTDDRVRAVELGVAKLEGLLEGLRDAITVRVVRTAASQRRSDKDS